MEKYLLPILENGGPVGAIVVVAVLLLGFYLRNKGWLLGDKSQVVSSSQLSDLSTRVGAIDNRLGAVEENIDHLPTRKEIHTLELAHERIVTRIAVLEATATATKAGVIRIEDFLINLSKGASK